MQLGRLRADPQALACLSQWQSLQDAVMDVTPGHHVVKLEGLATLQGGGCGEGAECRVPPDSAQLS